MNDSVAGPQQVGVVIVNYQSWKPLRDCLQELAQESSAQLEVVVVDNDSPDDQLEFFRQEFPAVVFMKNPGNPGFAQACNLGARQCNSEILLFLNPDARIAPKSVAGLARLLWANPDFGILSPCLTDSNQQCLPTGEVFPSVLTQFPFGRGVAKRLARKRWCAESVADIQACDYVPGCALMIRREIFAQLRGWSEKFWMYCEDIDLCWRVRESGLKVGWTKKFLANHIQGQSSQYNEAVTVRCRAEHIRARHLLYQRHLSGAGRFMTQLCECLKRLARLAGPALLDFIFRGRNQKWRVRRKVLASVLGYYSDWLAGMGPGAPLRV